VAARARQDSRYSTGEGLTQRPREFTVHPGGVLEVDRFLAFVDREAPKAIADEQIRRVKQSAPVRHESETKRAAWMRRWLTDWSMGSRA
jgi:hypothetical protein